jgi:hypothetical protein
MSMVALALELHPCSHMPVLNWSSEQPGEAFLTGASHVEYCR